MTRQLRVAVLSGLFLLSSLAMIRTTRAQSGPPDPTAVMDQMTNIPYFTLRDGMSSTLTVQNLATTPTKVMVTIFNTEGRAHALDPITLDPHSFKEVQLAEVAPSDFDSGNVEIAYNGTMMSVTCQVSVSSVRERVSFESREQDMMDFESTSMAGILSLPKGATGFLAVTNIAKNRLTFQLTAGSLKKTVALDPRETELLKLNEDDTGSPTLVKLQHNGMPGDVITTGYVLDLKNGYSTGFAMLDPGIMRSSVLAGAHFRAGQADPRDGFPEGTRFHSPLLLGNVSASPVVAHVSVDYTVREKVQMTPINPNQAGATEDSFKNTLAVKDLTIAPGDVRSVELADALGGVGQITEAGVDVSYDAAPGAVIGQLTSVDQSGDYSFEVPIKDPDAMTEVRESAYPWTVENGTLTVLHLKNTTNDIVQAGAVLSFAGGVYQLDKLTLQPHQTISLDIQKLKDSQQPDALGRVFPASATHGQANWFEFTPYSMIGRAENTDVHAGIASSFSCGADNCCSNYSWTYSLSPDPMAALLSQGSGILSATEYYTNCTGITNTYLNEQANATSWTSSNSSVATVSVGDVTFVGPGETLITGNFPTYYYTYPPPLYSVCTRFASTDSEPSPVTVNPPNHLVVVQDVTSLLAGCPATVTPPFYRQLAMNIVDVNGTPVIGATAQESFTGYTGNTCPSGLAPKPAPCGSPFPNSAEFVDNITVNTCNVPTSPLWCGYSLTDEWQWCGSSTPNGVVKIGKLTDIVHSNQITINGNASPLTPGSTNVQSFKPGTPINP